MGIRELEFFLLGPGDEDISITSFADNARDEGGYSRFVLLDTRRGKEVAHAARFAEQAKKERSQRGRLEEEVHRIAEPRTSQVSAHEVTDDTKRENIGAGRCHRRLAGRAQHQGPKSGHCFAKQY